MRRRTWRISLVISMAMLGLVLSSGSAAADVVDCDGGGSLQSAVDAALPGSIVEFTGTCTENIFIDRDLEIVGQGTAIIDGSGGFTSSTITIPAPVVVTLRNVTVTGGSGLDGGGIDSLGDLTIFDSILEGNNAGDSGGGIDANGPLTIIDSVIRNNTAPSGGGVFTGFVAVFDGVEISDNSAVLDGGGVYNLGTLDLVGSEIVGNQSSRGGGFVNDGTDAQLVMLDSSVLENQSTSGIGGGIANWNSAIVIVENSIVGDNQATGGSGGGVYNAEESFGLGAGEVWLIDSLVSGNGAGGGGGVFNEGGFLVVDGTTIEEHISSAGAGISNTLGGTVEILDSIIGGNTAGTGGGGIFSDSGDVEIESSLFVGNTADGLAPGGAILNLGGFMSLSTTTISSNTAYEGGGIFNASPGIVELAGVTVVDNSATGESTGGGINNSGGSAVITATILAGNTSSVGPDCAGAVGSGGYNLIEDVSGCGFTPFGTTDLTGVDPLLDTLAANFGLIPTHALLPGSPAIDHVPSDRCGGLLDQRGIRRPRGPACDVGAFEVDYLPDDVLLVQPNGLWHIRQEGAVDRTFWYGVPGDIPLLGDWEGDGVDTPGMWRQGPGGGFAYLTDALPLDGEVGVAEFDFFFGNPGDQVFSGDWNGDGIDTLGINRGGHIFLADSNGSLGGPVPTDRDFFFGVPGDRAFGGDPDGDGRDSVMLYRESDGFVYFTNETPVGPGAVAATADNFFFGIASDSFVSGDWDGDQGDTAGIFRSSDTTVYLSNTNAGGGDPAPTDDSYSWGGAGWTPVAGSWE